MAVFPLNLNFNQTFSPERKYLLKIMELASNKTLENLSPSQIMDITGIPTGKSSGKVVPHILYAQGMGLIEEIDSKFLLTDFGRVVMDEDPYMQEEITMWLMHAFLCNEQNGAIIWSRVFKNMLPGIGYSIKDLSLVLNIQAKMISSVLISYEKDQCLPIHVFERSRDVLIRLSAPIDDYCIIAYAALFSFLFENSFPHSSQIVLNEFIEKTGITWIFNWDESMVIKCFNLMNSLGLFKIHSLVKPIVIQPIRNSSELFSIIYNNCQ